MADQVAQQLKQLMIQYGPQLANEPRRVHALLRDLCPQQKREVHVLSSVAEEGLARSLAQDGGKTSAAILLSRLSERLHDELGIDQTLARWGVTAWAEALGLDTGSHAQSSPARLNTGSQRDAVPEKRLTNSLGMEFVYIEPGTFMMGSPPDEPGRFSHETKHQVTLTQGYYMQTTPVTQGQWEAVMGSNPSYFFNCGSDCPVENVSWQDAQEFIRKLNRCEGKGVYCLPTEAQWEYAARAGTTTPFYFGRCLSTDQANYYGNFPLESVPESEYRKKTTPVKMFSANAWGLYDIHGNVLEWVADWYGAYPTTAVTDFTGPTSGTNRVIRGGSWNCNGRNCRSASRNSNSPDLRIINGGFRLVLLPGH